MATEFGTLNGRDIVQDSAAPGVPIVDLTGDGGDVLGKTLALLAVGPPPFVVDTVAALTALASPYLMDGQLYRTLRYSSSHTVGDGSGNLYRYVAASAATVDSGFVLNGPGSVGRFLAVDQSVANVMQFGAIGDGTTDDTDAIKAAINSSAGSASYASSFCPTVYFPAGTYKIDESGVFSYATTATRKGMIFRGDGMLNSIITLDVSDDTEKWLYDNAANNRYQFCTFRDLWFRSTEYISTSTVSDPVGRAFANGFHQTSTGHEQNFSFERCQFTSLQKVFRCSGTANADANKFIGCRVWDCFNVLTLDNSQSLAHDFVSCQLQRIHGDAFVIEDGGGGEINVFGGDLIMVQDAGDTDDHFMIRIDQGAFGGSAGQVNFWGGRTELHDDESKVVSWPGTGSQGKVTFNSYNFMHFEGTRADADMLELGLQAYVEFNNCLIPSYWGIYIDSNAGSAAARATTGGVVFNNCAIHHTLSENITLNTAYGFVSAINCRNSDATRSLYNLEAMDFDYNGWNSGTAISTPRLKRAKFAMAAVGWPRSSGTAERFIILPAGATVVGIEIYKPAGGADGTSTTWAVTNNDESVTYCETTPAAHNALHYERVGMSDTNMPISVNSLASRQLKLIGGTTTATTVGGWVMVEYY